MENSTIELPDFPRFPVNYKYGHVHSSDFAQNQIHELSNFIFLSFSLPDKDRHILALLQKIK